MGLIPGLGTSPGEGNGCPLQYSCLENPMDRGACRLQSVRSQRVRHDWATKTHLVTRSSGHQVWAVLEGAWRLLGPLSAVEAHPEEADSSRPPCSLQCPQLGSKPFFENASRHHFVHQVLCLNKIWQSEICYFGILWSHRSENTLSLSHTLRDKSMVGCESTRWWLPEAMACWDGDWYAAVCEGVFSGFIAPAKRQRIRQKEKLAWEIASA